MLILLTDYHVHLETGPYTIEWVQQYLLTANSRGIKDIGFSEHGYRFKQSKQILYNPWVAKHQTEDIEQYVELVLEAKKIGLPVKLGLELDYIPGKEREIEDFLNPYPWDYVIGSVHWIDSWGFDIYEMKSQWSNSNIIDVYKLYYERVEQLVQSQLFDILGHIDVIKVFGHKPEEEYKDMLHDIYSNLVSIIKKNNITVEMSTAGLRKPVKELYPDPIIMKLLAENNIPMIINSDAHHPEHVGYDYDKGIEYLRKNGINNISTFENRIKTMVPLG